MGEASLHLQNSVLPLEETAMLNRYFDHPWRQPLSYYNSYAAIFYANKVKISHGRSLDTESNFFLTPCQNLLLKVDTADPIFHLIAAKDKSSAEVFSQILKDRTAHPVILHVPDFEPDLNKHVVTRTYEQVVYDCRFVVENIQHDITQKSNRILNARSAITFKKNQRECTYREVRPCDEDVLKTIIHFWGVAAAAKAKNCYLFKDYLSIPWALNGASTNTIAYVGFRKTDPISYSLLATFPGMSKMAVQLIAKSLNYALVPGGYNETAIWELYHCCQECLAHGIEYINASDAVPLGLRSFKQKFAGLTKPLKCFDWKPV